MVAVVGAVVVSFRVLLKGAVSIAFAVVLADAIRHMGVVAGGVTIVIVNRE